jgi:hypothetical protein
MFDFNEDISMDFRDFKEVIPPNDRFWADPHVIHIDGHYYIFIEEYLYKISKAHISVIEMDRHGNYKEPTRVLEKDYHLSYPFVFQWEDMFYMVPESEENGTIELYECEEFPYKWKFKMNLMENVHAVDTTLLQFQGKWWLFTGMAEGKDSLPFVKLYLFYSNDFITSEWKPHSQNPIISDGKKARPAGSLFVRNGMIFRPSQNCSVTYGYGIYLNEILLLSESEYLEKTVVSVKPDWDRKIEATHTFVSKGNLTIIDAFTRRRRILWARRPQSRFRVC